MYVGGVDVGKTGALAFIEEETGRVVIFDTPKSSRGWNKIFETVKPQEIRVIGIEKQHAYRGNGLKSTFMIGMEYGIVLGIVNYLQIPYILITPKHWQKVMLKERVNGRKESKMLSLARAKELYPQVWIGAKHGRSDALLIATLMLKLYGENNGNRKNTTA